LTANLHRPDHFPRFDREHVVLHLGKVFLVDGKAFFSSDLPPHQPQRVLPEQLTAVRIQT